MKEKEKILVLEDERSLRLILCDNLKFDGFHVLPASSGKEALELASKERPDLAVVDVGLPDMDGWEVVRRLRSEEKTKNVVILMLSGNFGEEVNQVPSGIGPNQLVAKPYEYSTLLERIRVLLRKTA